MEEMTNHGFYIDRRKDSVSLNGTWQFGFGPSDEQALETGLPYTTELPASAYKSVQDAGLLPPYYFGNNSEQYRFLRGQVFAYRRRFFVPAEKAGLMAFFCMDGADYSTDVILNGKNLGTHFGISAGPYLRVDAFLKYGEENEVTILARSAKYVDPGFDSWNMKNENTAVLSWGLAGDDQCSNGNFFIQGIHEDIRLEYVSSVHLSRPFLSTVAIKPHSARLRLSTEVTRAGYDETQVNMGDRTDYQFFAQSAGTWEYLRKTMAVTLTLMDGDKEVLCRRIPFHPYNPASCPIPANQAQCQYVEADVTLPNPKLWFPADMGTPCLYTARVTLTDGKKLLDEQSFPFGVRTVTWEQTPAIRQYRDVQRYQIVINGKRHFLRGINTIPPDYLLDRDDERLEKLLKMAIGAHMSLIRLWGAAGIYASDRFYEMCDRLGIFVWQDSITGNTDMGKWDVRIVRSLVSANLYRIRNHPSLAVHCGGNEINPYSPGVSAVIGVIHQTTAIVDPTRHFFESTPLGGEAHIYNDMEPNQYRKKYINMPFIGESGIHSFPSYQSLTTDIPAGELEGACEGLSVRWQKAHPGIVCHIMENRPDRIPRMLKRAGQLTDTETANLHQICQATQLSAAEYYQIMIPAIAENYPATSGILPWVLTRAWNTVGIELIDKATTPLLGYFAVKDAFAPLCPTISFRELSFGPGEEMPMDGCILNYLSVDAGTLRVQARIYGQDLRLLYEDGCDAVSGSHKTDFSLRPFAIPAVWGDGFFFVVLTMTDEAGHVEKRTYRPKCLAAFAEKKVRDAFRKSTEPNHDWTGKKPMDQQLAACPTAVSARREGSTLTLRNTGDRPAYPVILESLDTAGFDVSDNGFLLEPGEEKILTIGEKTGSVLISGFNFAEIHL